MGKEGEEGVARGSRGRSGGLGHLVFCRFHERFQLPNEKSELTDGGQVKWDDLQYDQCELAVACAAGD